MPRAVVTGGAGFLGSHLCRALVGRGWDVLAVDSLLTGRIENIEDLFVVLLRTPGPSGEQVFAGLA